MCVPEDVFPEYYIIRVNEFNDVATTPIEEWLDYLKNNRISDTTTTPGLREARERLLYLQMTDKERHAYDAHMDDIMVQNDVLDTAKMEGRAEGREEGRAEGRAEGLAEGRAEATLSNAKSLKVNGVPIETIAVSLGLTIEEVEAL